MFNPIVLTIFLPFIDIIQKHQRNPTRENISWACTYNKYSDKTIMQEMINEMYKYEYPQTPSKIQQRNWTQMVNRNVTEGEDADVQIVAIMHACVLSIQLLSTRQ